MNIDQLKYFLKVAEMGHITHAAEELNISEPALSKSILRLEEEIGVDLFDRVGRSIRLNNKGIELVPHVQNALKSLDTGLQLISDMKDQDDHFIKLQSMPLVIFPGLFDMILSEFPNVTFSNSRENLSSLIDNLLTAQTDLCFSARKLEHANISSKRLYSEPVYLIVSPDHPLAGKSFVCAEDVLDEKFVAANRYSTLSFSMEKLFAYHSDCPKSTIEISTLNEALEYIARNLCVSLMPLSVYSDLVRRGQYNLKLIAAYDSDQKPLTNSYTLYWHKKRNSESIQAMKKLIVNYFQNTYSNSIVSL